MNNQVNPNGNLNPQQQMGQPVPQQGMEQPVVQPQMVQPQQPVSQPVPEQPVVPQQPLAPQQPVAQPAAQPMMQPQLMASQPQPMANQPQPMAQPSVAPIAEVPKKTSGVCIAALIFAFLISPVGLILGIVGLATYKKNNQKGKGLAIAAILISILLPVLMVVLLFGGLIGLVNSGTEAATAIQEGCNSLDANGAYESIDGAVICEDFYCEYNKDGITLSSSCNLISNTNDDDNDEDTDTGAGSVDTVPVTSNTLNATSWVLSDNSEMKFSAVGGFAWYKAKDVYNDNYYSGSYRYYEGKEAVKVITTELSNYGVTEDELQSIFDSSEIYNEENFVVIIVKYSNSLINGQYEANTNLVPLYGFMLQDGTFLDVANMNTGNYYKLTKRA